jgi:hypothetical protein
VCDSVTQDADEDAATPGPSADEVLPIGDASMDEACDTSRLWIPI